MYYALGHCLDIGKLHRKKIQRPSNSVSSFILFSFCPQLHVHESTALKFAHLILHHHHHLPLLLYYSSIETWYHRLPLLIFSLRHCSSSSLRFALDCKPRRWDWFREIAPDSILMVMLLIEKQDDGDGVGLGMKAIVDRWGERSLPRTARELKIMVYDLAEDEVEMLISWPFLLKTWEKIWVCKMSNFPSNFLSNFFPSHFLQSKCC